MNNSKLDVAVYFEGVYIPVKAVTVYAEVGRPPSANIILTYMGWGEELMLTTIVEIFCRYQEQDSPDVPVIDAYKLLFHGEVVAAGVSREGASAHYIIRAQAPNQYLNRMPNYFAWAYTREQYSYALQDYDYLGLKYGGGGVDFAMRWFTDGSLLQLANTRKNLASYNGISLNGGEAGNDNYGPYTPPVISAAAAVNINMGEGQTPAELGIKDPTHTPRGVGALRANGLRYHQGEDYGIESGVKRGDPLFIPYDGCIMGICSKEGGSIRFQTPDKKHKIVIYHALDVHSEYSPGTIMPAGVIIGRVGNVKTSANHLHIELWSDYDPGSGDYYKYDYDFGIEANRVVRDLPNNPAGVRGQGIYGIYHVWPDCLMRILGKGSYASGSTPATAQEMQRYSLQEYLDGLLDALATCVDRDNLEESYYTYYANANRRHRIKDNHIVKDYPLDGFESYYGADVYDSYMNHTYSNLYRYRDSMYSYLISNLATIGYISYPVLSPLYDREHNRLNEYIVTPGFYHHAPPQFNVIAIGRGDSVNIMDSGYPLTAVKYRSIMNDLSVREYYSPKGMAHASLNGNYEDAKAEINNAYAPLVAQEKIYGLNRRVDDISYYYDSFLARASSIAEDNDPESMVQRLCDLNRTMNSRDTSSVHIGISGLNLNPVVGLPALAHCPLLGKDYYGMIQQITHTIDLQAGYSSTTLVLAFPQSEIKIDGITPASIVDRAIAADLDKCYGELFYQDTALREVSVRAKEQLLDLADLPYMQRSLCSMRDYLTMNKHQSLDIPANELTTAISQYTTISDIDNLITSSEGANAVPSATIDSNAHKLIKVDKISDLYIWERYRAALAVASAIRGPKRTLIVQEG